jgi:hypothetical protein
LEGQCLKVSKKPVFMCLGDGALGSTVKTLIPVFFDARRHKCVRAN